MQVTQLTSLDLALPFRNLKGQHLLCLLQKVAVKTKPEVREGYSAGVKPSANSSIIPTSLQKSSVAVITSWSPFTLHVWNLLCISLLKAAITEYHSLGGFNSSNLFPTVLEARQSKIKVWSCPMPCLFTVSSTGLGRWGSESSGLFLSSHHRVPSSWLHLNLITFQRPYLQIPKHWWLELQYKNFGRLQFSPLHSPI